MKCQMSKSFHTPLRRASQILCIALCAFAATSICAEEATTLPAGVKALQAPGVHNLFALSTNLFSGSAPEGDEGFAALAKLGIKTIVTVDGTRPDIERAHKFGMRYIHLPHGYDGIDAHTQALLVKSAETAPGPIFVHCHHGKHRGPAAVAVMCMSELSWSPAQADAWLQAAGTATNYQGLYAVVRNFQKPSAADLQSLPTELPEVSKISGLTDAMVEIDARFDNLKAIRGAGYAAPKNNPDLDPSAEAVVLWEHFREAQRLPESAAKGPKFSAQLAAAETEAKKIETLLNDFSKAPPETRASARGRLDKAIDAIASRCSACHREYRDPAGIKSRN